MKSIKQATKEFDMEEIRRRAAEARKKARLRSSTSDTKRDGSHQNSYRCPKCKDEEGFLTRSEDGAEIWRICDCKGARRSERLFKSSSITEKFQQKSFNSFSLNVDPGVLSAYHCAKEYAKIFGDLIKSKEKNNGIALLGQVGSGKTHLLMAIANHLIRHGVQVVYFPWVEGFNEIKDNLSLLDERIQQLQKAEVLYIDDVFKGRSRPTEFQIEQLFAIVNYRYLEGKPMMISSEKTMNEMCEFDQAIGSRISEMCENFTVVIDREMTSNYRLRKDKVVL
ncbi:ATP-binding protein [Paenibacillus aquistagni]|nr:ATP-binding protein [Paenibacillus aquistagni]